MDFGSKMDSWVGSRFDSKVELESGPSFAIAFGFVAGSHSVTSFDSTTEECSHPAIL